MFAIVCSSQVAMGGHMAKGEAFSPHTLIVCWKLIPGDLIEEIYIPTIEKTNCISGTYDVYKSFSDVFQTQYQLFQFTW